MHPTTIGLNLAKNPFHGIIREPWSNRVLTIGFHFDAMMNLHLVIGSILEEDGDLNRA